jgi:hypothetical protein
MTRFLVWFVLGADLGQSVSFVFPTGGNLRRFRHWRFLPSQTALSIGRDIKGHVTRPAQAATIGANSLAHEGLSRGLIHGSGTHDDR